MGDKTRPTESRFAGVPQPLSETAAIDLRAEVERLLAEVEALRAEAEKLRQRAEVAEAAADHDVLTPALNRRGFMTVLTRTMARCARYEGTAALIYLDLDGFKGVNDQHGHAAGDVALVEVAQLLIDNVRESDSVARLGGDEFGLLLLNASAEEARDKAMRLSQALAEKRFGGRGQEAQLGGSFGVRVWAEQPDAETWLAEADAAMWVRKRSR